MWKIIITFACLVGCICFAQAQSISQYEYWLDGDYANKTTVTGSETDISISLPLEDLGKGLHFFNFRSINDKGEISNVYRTLFYLPEADPVDVGGYEYWFDNDDFHKVSVDGGQAFLSLDIDIANLEKGIHTFNFRARNSFDGWGPEYVYDFEVIMATSIEQEKNNAERFTVYNLAGTEILNNASWKDLKTLPCAIYVIQGRKILVK